MELKDLYDKVYTMTSELRHLCDEQAEQLRKRDEKDAEKDRNVTQLSTDLHTMEEQIRSIRASYDRPVLATPGVTYAMPGMRVSAGDYLGNHSTKERLDEASRKRYDLFWQGVRYGISDMDQQQRREFKERFLVRRGSDLDERQFAQAGLTIQEREGVEQKALTLGDETAGGYLAPPEFVQDVLKGVQLISPIRPLASIRQTSRRSVQYPTRTGVFAARWIGETGARTETAGLAYALEEIPNHEMYADVLVSDTDIEDSVFDLEQEILDNCTEQFAKAEGAAFVNGSGSGQPEGILTNSLVATDTSTFNATTHTMQASGILTIWGNLKTVYAKNATWLMNRQTIVAARSLVDNQGRYLWEPGLADGTPPNLLGSPYIEVPDMPNLPASAGNANAIIYGNIKRGYLIVDRINVIVRRLQEKYAESGQIAYLVRKRVGGQVVIPEAIRKLNLVFA